MTVIRHHTKHEYEITDMDDKWHEWLHVLELIALFLVMLIVLGATAWWLRRWPRWLPAAETGTNLLANPGFEGTYISYAAEVRVAEGWRPAYVEGRMGRPGMGISGGSAEGMDFRRPEYKPAELAFSYRVRTGQRAQCWFSWSAIHYAGVWQRVKAQPGRWYQLSVYAQSWASNSEDPLQSGEMYLSLGIDPTGSEWLERRGIVWTGWQIVPAPQSLKQESKNWQLYRSLPVQAQGEWISVWIVSSPKWALKHGDIYVDDAALVEVELGGSCPTPVPCPTPVGDGCDYEQIRSILHDELLNREPVKWPR